MRFRASVAASGRPPHDVTEVAAVFFGGVIGALARAGLVEAWPPQPGHWPWVTFCANVAGAALVGWLAVHYGSSLRGPRYRFWGSGLCGALTTFSTMQLELLELLDADRSGLAFAYAATSIVAGLAAVAAGSALQRRLESA